MILAEIIYGFVIFMQYVTVLLAATTMLTIWAVLGLVAFLIIYDVILAALAILGRCITSGCRSLLSL